MIQISDPMIMQTRVNSSLHAGRAARGRLMTSQGSCHVALVDASRDVTSCACLGGAGDVSGTQVGLLIVLWAAVPVLTGRGQQLVPA